MLAGRLDARRHLHDEIIHIMLPMNRDSSTPTCLVRTLGDER